MVFLRPPPRPVLRLYRSGLKPYGDPCLTLKTVVGYDAVTICIYDLNPEGGRRRGW
jgi:hypothetical protein